MSRPEPGPRLQRRAATDALIVSAASARLREHGPAGLTVRGIAADVGLSPAAIYRYYDGRDAILTALIASGYASLGAALTRADGAPATDPLDRVRTVALAYREWAMSNAHEFQLLFGAPIPGYAAPRDGDTTAALERALVALLRPALEGFLAGRLTIPPAFDTTDPGQAAMAASIAAAAGAQVPPSFALWATQWWSQVHGLVALELNGQFAWLYDSDASAQFEAVLGATLAAVAPRSRPVTASE